MGAVLTAPLRTPGAAVPAVGSLIARLAIAMGTVALLIHVQQRTGDIGAAALATAAVLVGSAAGSPWQGRAVDRHGPRRVYGVVLVAFVPAASALLAAVELGVGPLGTVPAGLAFGLARPALAAPSRALWDRLVPDGDRTPGYTYESVSMETLFIVGPALAATLGALAWPGTGLAVAMVASLLGTVLFVLAPAVRRWGPRPVDDLAPARALTPGLRTTLLLVAGFGLATGPVEVTVVAAAAQAGVPAAAGPMIALWSAVSVAAGVLYQRRPRPRELRLRGPVLLGVFAAVVVAIGLPLLASPIPGLVGTAVLMALAGAVITPQVTTHSLLVARTVPPAAASEAFGWVLTAVTVGLAVGQVGAGQAITAFGLPAAVVMGGVGGLVLAAIAWRRRATLDPSVP